MARRVLWIGDAGCHTGFGRVTHSIGDRLVSTFGHSVDVLAINHRGDPWDTPMRLWPANLRSSMDVYGKSRIVELISKVDPEVVIILHDPEVVFSYFFRNKQDPTNALLSYAPILTYMPIDGIGNPPIWESIGKFSTRVAMTTFGQSQMPGSELVFHGVDPDLYHPVSKDRPYILSDGTRIESKADAKRALGYDPNGFFVLRVDRNSTRKNYPDTWRALVPLMKKYSDIEAHFHCMPKGDGFEFPNILAREQSVADRFHFPAEETHNTFMGWPDTHLAVLYNAADVFVSTSWAEGFGLTIAEAMACGVPVVAQNCSAITEVVGPGGILIDPVRPITVPTGQDQWLPDVDAFTAAIERLYHSKGARRDLGRAARKHVEANYSWDTATAQFDELIETVIARAGKESDAGAAEAADVQDRDGGAEGG